MANRLQVHRVETACDTCGQLDADPKHHLAGIGRAESHHHDCGASAGCDVCSAIEAQSGGLRYDQLAAHVQRPETARALAAAIGSEIAED